MVSRVSIPAHAFIVWGSYVELDICIRNAACPRPHWS